MQAFGGTGTEFSDILFYVRMYFFFSDEEFVAA